LISISHYAGSVPGPEGAALVRKERPELIEPGDLVRACGEHADSERLWSEFQFRYQKLIFHYVLRAARASAANLEEVRETLPDLVQQVYFRLVQNNGRILRTFRGDTDFAVRALLARVSTSVLVDHYRYEAAQKRAVCTVRLEDTIDVIDRSPLSGFRSTGSGEDEVLAGIDFGRRLLARKDQKNSARDALIFKLYYVDGLTASEIASCRSMNLTVRGVESVLSKMRRLIRA
jgi:RNA polymerase sigma-70 factor (ECF subfamily)